MKKLFLILFIFHIFFLIGDAFALKYPKCKKTDKIWSNCRGTTQWGNYYYKGEFLNDMRYGQGELLYPNGDKYTGGWKNNKRHGKGVHLFKDTYSKTLYNVMPKNDSRVKYEGNWFNDKFHGEGILLYKRNKKYTGGFINGKKYGFGSFKYTRKSNYIGFWKNDLMDGLGSFLLEDGSRMSGEWKNGGLKYTAKYCEKNLIHNCFMYMTLKNGAYFGYFQNGDFSRGIMKYSDGSIYQGTYKGGKENGYGSLTNSDGNTKDGIWISGMFAKKTATSDRKFLKESLKKLYYYNSDTADIEFDSLETIDFYSALISFLYDEGECTLAKAIENKTSKLENNIIKENDKSCQNTFFDSFRLRNYNISNKSIYQLLVLFIFNDKFYSLLKSSISRTQ